MRKRIKKVTSGRTSASKIFSGWCPRPSRSAALCDRWPHDPARGLAVSQQKRKRIEEPFGWGKTIGGLARPMLRGARKLGFKFTLTMASYNLIRIPKLIAAAA
jgi:hypothetical protein